MGRQAGFRRFTVDEYQRLTELGFLTGDDRVELIEGYLVHKMPHNPPHDGTILRLSKRLVRFLPGGWDVRTQSSLKLSDSVPEPDLAIVRADPDDYMTRHPTPADFGLLIEVADTTVQADRVDKQRIYARDGVPCYWIVNIPDRKIEVYTQPSGPTAAPSYGRRQDYRPGDAVPVELDGAMVGVVAVSDVAG